MSRLQLPGFFVHALRHGADLAMKMWRPEVANAVVFLASPRASFITGTNLIIDGALTQRVQF
jgi:NAD(P)-dependent dehydrogenase (short-subunit alcohol dehydrogenase family)